MPGSQQDCTSTNQPTPIEVGDVKYPSSPTTFETATKVQCNLEEKQSGPRDKPIEM
jgi:hypothetical protein